MLTANTDKAIAIGAKTAWNNSFDIMRKNLLSQGINMLVADAHHELDQNEAYLHSQLKCNTAQAAPGCNVTVRYQQLVLRDMPPTQVFAQLLTAFEIANDDPRVVAINIVQPEDSFYALRDYHLQMQMIDYLHRLYPKVHISLHAGELSPGSVTPEQLAFHIRDAIETGHAERIGHGIDIAGETNSQQLLHEMAAKHIPVEVCLTSNALILGIQGNQHPLHLYLKSGVPVVLATDDEGVLRTDLTHEYQRAASTYGLDYQTLKNLARNSLTYSFMQGNSLWQDPKQFLPIDACNKEKLGAKKLVTATCKNYLQQNPKAQLQWNMEMDFNGFEQQMAQIYRAQLALQ
jgi:adenosine deaminase